jgi:hypothetical protein
MRQLQLDAIQRQKKEDDENNVSEEDRKER